MRFDWTGVALVRSLTQLLSSKDRVMVYGMGKVHDEIELAKQEIILGGEVGCGSH